jgi:2-phospho-L-lactate guanylyltransferase
MWVVVPVKRFFNAKTRLAKILSDAERESLAQVMLNDVLLAISNSHLVSGILVISNEIRARYSVERLGGLFLEEQKAGLSAAVAQAGRWLSKHGQRGLLMIPGDVPLVRSADLDHIIQSHDNELGVTIVPDIERDGTNALAVSPVDLIDFSFGRKSFEKHLIESKDKGLSAKVLASSGLSLDIDNVIDLQMLLSFDNETETLAYLADSGIARRVLPRRDKSADNVTVAAPSLLM